MFNNMIRNTVWKNLTYKNQHKYNSKPVPAFKQKFFIEGIVAETLDANHAMNNPRESMSGDAVYRLDDVLYRIENNLMN
jgi:uncharacterized protein (DUF1919 family)